VAVIMRSLALVSGTAYPTPGITQLWWSPGTVGGSTADATDVLDRFRDFWEAFKSHLSTSVTIDYDPVCIAVEATTGVLTGAFAGTEPASTTGTFAGDALPRQTQGLVRLGTSTVINGRRVQGRLFVPGVCEADNAATGVPSSTFISDLNTAAATLLAAGATASDVVVWHRPVGGAGGASPDITATSVSPNWAVLRSRRS
jgi:hypothetical protein